MKEIVRRMIMMIGIVSIGTILIFLNASVIITISATLAFGIIMAMGLGLLKTDDFKKINVLKKNPIKDTKNKKENKKHESETDKKSIISGKIFSRFQKNETKNNQTPGTKKGKKSRLSDGLSAALGSFSETINKTRDKGHSEKINTLLNSTIDEPITKLQDTDVSTPELSLSDSTNESSDEMGIFDDEDFGNLDSLEIEGEESSFEFDTNDPTGSQTVEKYDSDELNLDDEINSILLSENAFDEPDDFSSEDLKDTISSGSHQEDAGDRENQEILPEEGMFNSEEFFVQGIEDGLDEESFINLPDTFTESHNDSLDELNNITEFEKINQNDDDDFSDFSAINLEELETDDLSIETDDIIIEDEEEINDSDMLPDDFIPSPDAGSVKSETGQNLANKNDLVGSSGFNTPGLNEPISFSGKNEYDDIMGTLESEIKITKKVSHASLVRDMKDVHVEAKDLVEELETVLHSMGGKPSKSDYQSDGSE